jgi:hypothetical protein
LPGVLTHQAIVLMARRRLEQMATLLEAKIATGTTVTDLEHRLAALARQAWSFLGGAPQVDVPSASLGAGASKFAVLGAMGPDLLGFRQPLGSQPPWLQTMVHTASPDPLRSPAFSGTTDFVLELWRQVKSRSPDDGALAAMRAYVYGHLCHVAADVVAHPWVSDRAWHLTLAGQQRFTVEGGEGELDARVARDLFGRASLRSESWDGFWPTVDIVPDLFYDAYAAAVNQIYFTPTRPQGLHAFEQAMAGQSLAPPTAGEVKDALAFFVHGALGVTYAWGHWTWAAVQLPAALGLWLLMPLSAAMPHLRDVLGGTFDGAKVAYEMLGMPLALAAPVTLAYGIWATATSHGATKLAVAGLVLAALETIAAGFFFGTLGVSDHDFPYWLRWLLFIVFPAGTSIGFFAYALRNWPHRLSGGAGALALLYSMPLAFVVAFVAFYWLVLVGRAAGGPGTGVTVEFAVLCVVAFILYMLLWQFLSHKLRDAFLPELPPVGADVTPVPEAGHFVRLFDETTMAHARPVADVPLVAPRDVAHEQPAGQFPTDRRPILKLWWDGTGEKWIRSDRYQLVFASDANGTGAQAFPAPLVPQTAAEYGAWLAAAVDGAHLHFALVADEAGLEPELPPGATFSDHGDGEITVAAHDAAAARFIKLGSTNSDSAYQLFHAPRALQAVRYGRGGPVLVDGRDDVTTPGGGTLASEGTRVRGTDTQFGVFFAPGDVLRASNQDRVVMAVVSDRELQIASGFDSDLAAGTSYVRVGVERELREGYTFVTNAPNTVGGDAIMDYAADLAALFCLGVTPHLLDSAAVPTLNGKSARSGGAVDPALARAYQVFRNWNLDLRRVNEWRMLVAGSALSEKHGPSDTYDETMTRPRPSGYTPRANPLGEKAALSLGWVGLLRRWLESAGRRDQDMSAGGVGSALGNLDLSRGLAFLLDLPDPVALR